MRRYFVLIHRWAGLAMAGFLLVVGLTGSLLAFYPELERWTNPERYADRPPETWLPAGELAAGLEAGEPRLRVKALYLQYYDGTANATIEPRIDPATGRPFPLGYRRLALDPATGAVLHRIGGSFAEDGRSHVWSFVYHLHYALALGPIGGWILGVTALVWTLDCFVGFYLTLPPGRRKPGWVKPVKPTARTAFAAEAMPSRPPAPAPEAALERKSRWQRWAPAWRIRWRAGGSRFNFDLHRAGGLWLWPLLFIFAWSGVGMDLLDTVYTWTMRAVFDYRPPWTEVRPLPEPLEQPRLGWREAQAAAATHMADAARQHGFVVLGEVALHYDGEHGVYVYQVQSDREIGARPLLFSTQLRLDANTGALKHLLLPSGQHTGNTVSHWLYALHMANVFGFPYRVLVSVLGLAIVVLSVTGVIIWLQKRRARWRRRPA